MNKKNNVRQLIFRSSSRDSILLTKIPFHRFCFEFIFTFDVSFGVVQRGSKTSSFLFPRLSGVFIIIIILNE